MSTLEIDLAETENWLNPERLELYKKFSLEADDESLSVEFPNFSNYARFFGDRIVIDFLETLDAHGIMGNPDALEDLKSRWERSGFKDPVISFMIDMILKYFELYNSTVLEYLMIRHFHQRMDIGGEFRIKEKDLMEILRLQPYMSDRKFKLLHLLADATTEMIKPMRHAQSDVHNDLYYSHVGFFLKRLYSSPPEFRRRVKFLEKDKRGKMIRYFEFVYHFEESSRRDLSSVQDAASLVFEVFTQGENNIAQSYEYLEYRKDRLGFTENLYHQYLSEIGELED